jgi:hypothetical protein
MSVDPRTHPDPQPGDIDPDLEAIDARYVERHSGDRAAIVRILVSVDGEDARRLERLAEVRGRSPSDLIADLLRDADGSTA